MCFFFCFCLVFFFFFQVHSKSTTSVCSFETLLHDDNSYFLCFAHPPGKITVWYIYIVTVNSLIETSLCYLLTNTTSRSVRD